MTKIEQYLEENKDAFKSWLVDNEQGRVDIKMLPYLKGIENGVFIEAGALDGLFMSNTKALEDLGWSGLLVEPSRKAAERCRKNRRVKVENCALVSKDYDKDTIMGDFVLDGESGLGAWSSVNHHAYGSLHGDHFNFFTTKIRARTLADVLNEHGIKKVDFFSLDVEGYELEVLKGIDFDKVEISYILVEVNLNDYKLEELDAYLAPFGYKNLGCLSGFSDNMEGWDGSHNDYLYQRD